MTAAARSLREGIDEAPPAKTQSAALAKVLAAVRRAPLASPEDRALAHALLAQVEQVESDPRTWSSTEQFMAKVAALPPDDE